MPKRLPLKRWRVTLTLHVDHEPFFARTEEQAKASVRELYDGKITSSCAKSRVLGITAERARYRGGP